MAMTHRYRCEYAPKQMCVFLYTHGQSYVYETRARVQQEVGSEPQKMTKTKKNTARVLRAVEWNILTKQTLNRHYMRLCMVKCVFFKHIHLCI